MGVPNLRQLSNPSKKSESLRQQLFHMFGKILDFYVMLPAGEALIKTPTIPHPLLSGPRSQSEKLCEKAYENMSEGSGLICISACLGSSNLQVFFCHIALSVVAFLATISRLVLISGLDCKGSFCHDHLLTQLSCWHSLSSISPDIKSSYQGGCPRSLLSCQDWSHSPIQIKRISCSTNQYMR